LFFRVGGRINQKRIQIGAGGIDCSSQSGRPGTNDYNLSIECLHGYPRLFCGLGAIEKM
jgi:hypothetical protein